jgi:hypothetical protein
MHTPTCKRFTCLPILAPALALAQAPHYHTSSWICSESQRGQWLVLPSVRLAE